MNTTSTYTAGQVIEYRAGGKAKRITLTKPATIDANGWMYLIGQRTYKTGRVVGSVRGDFVDYAPATSTSVVE